MATIRALGTVLAYLLGIAHAGGTMLLALFVVSQLRETPDHEYGPHAGEELLLVAGFLVVPALLVVGGLVGSVAGTRWGWLLVLVPSVVSLATLPWLLGPASPILVVAWPVSLGAAVTAVLLRPPPDGAARLTPPGRR